MEIIFFFGGGGNNAFLCHECDSVCISLNFSTPGVLGVDFGTTRRVLIGYSQTYDQKSEERVRKTGNGGVSGILKLFYTFFSK